MRDMLWSFFMIGWMAIVTLFGISLWRAFG